MMTLRLLTHLVQNVFKVGVLSFVLRNLPPKLNFGDEHSFGGIVSHRCEKMPLIPFYSLIDDKILESDGIDLPFSSEKVYGTICQITGDN